MKTLKQVLEEKVANKEYRLNQFVFVVYGNAGTGYSKVEEFLKQERLVNFYKVVKTDEDTIYVK